MTDEQRGSIRGEGETDGTEKEREKERVEQVPRPREASAWLNFLLNYYFNRKDERR